MNNNLNLYTDLITEKKIITGKEKIINKNNNLKVLKTTLNNNKYTTITFNDISTKNNYLEVQNILIKELKEYIKLKENDIILVIGLGNSKSTPDSLGPSVIDNVLVTRYLFLSNSIDKGYSNVSSFIPNVMGNTGINSIKIIKNIIKEIKATKVIIIDSLKTSNLDRLVKTIQITNEGISPGSGINNNRGEISKKNMHTEIIAIGVPTVVDIKTIIKEKENIIVTPTNIDFIIEKLSILIGNSINISLHKNFIRQK